MIDPNGTIIYSSNEYIEYASGKRLYAKVKDQIKWDKKQQERKGA